MTQITKEISTDMMDRYFDHIKSSYKAFFKPEKLDKDHSKRMIDEFNSKLRYEETKKYLKVIKNGSVHSFIVKEADGKYQAGDILKAASFSLMGEIKFLMSIY